MGKKVLKTLGIVLAVIGLAVAALFTYLTIFEYRPNAVEQIKIHECEASEPLYLDKSFHVMSWNIGYGGLGDKSDSLIDGGKKVISADKTTTQTYLEGIKQVAYEENDDVSIYLFQEVDLNSSRTYGIEERTFLEKNNNVFALNFSCPFVPYPFPPIGKVKSGVMSVSSYQIEQAQRRALFCPFKWPVRVANLKRCLLVSYIPIENSEHYLVMVNTHLEAYDDGEGKIEQTKQLISLLSDEYKKGNYVIAGGDFNQAFPDTLDTYPVKKQEFWTPSVLNDSDLGDGFQYVYDSSNPSCRLLNQPYQLKDEENTQYYVIDGFIVSDNIKVNEVKTLDMKFKCSDHNPVKLEVMLMKDDGQLNVGIGS